MAKILTIDSSTEACSVALDIEGEVSSSFEHAPRKHAELLLPMIDRLLSDANVELNQLSAISCSVGPGAFTGLRIAISVAQGLAYASGRPCIAISSLDALAEHAFAVSQADYCLSSIDARMQEVYFSVLKRDQQGGHKRVLDEQVIAPQMIDLPPEINNNNVIVKAGTGWSDYEYTHQVTSITSCKLIDNQGALEYPSARWMLPIANRKLLLGELLKPQLLQPIYLRNNVAVKKPTKSLHS